MNTNYVNVDIAIINRMYTVSVNGSSILSVNDKHIALSHANSIFAGLLAAKVNARWTDNAISIIYPK